MPVNTNATKLENLVNPEVLAPIINQKMIDAIKYTPLAMVDDTLQGRPGDTVTLPNFIYIGDAVDVAEGTDIPIKKLTSTVRKVTVKKAGNGVELTDESVLSGYGDPVGEAGRQLGLSIGAKVETDMIATLNTIGTSMTADITGALTSDSLADSLALFKEDLDGSMVLPIHPEQLAGLRKSEGWLKATDTGVTALMSGFIGMLHGVQVIVSNRVVKAAGGFTNFIIKPGAIALYLKRDLFVESDRDIVAKSTVITADKHYATYLYDASKAIKVVTTA